ncbi:lysylphosphatidylglycerol synthase transmembrane domain-containing protein [Halomarina litorea]|uniref:lysylphosphatidylglycerol synthase transmembrane domain-containing protein n=1 Tax=Halomarina litorea TaxID=2961595 RepID=UPI0020C2C370|nr:lysylphosphatidylglycerol synthase transmembrane domain-containing protein [Halomarina sp. BCD28]
MNTPTHDGSVDGREWRGVRRLVTTAVVGGVVVALAAALFSGTHSLPDGVDGRTLAGLLALAFVALACWGLSLHVVLVTLGAGVGPVRSVGLSLATKFVANVAPFGQAAGAPVSGLLVASATDLELERALTAVVTVSTLTSATGVALGIVALGGGGLGGSTTARVAASAPLVVGLGALVVAGWRRRRRVAVLLAAVLTPLARVVAPVHPRVDPPTREAVAARVDGLFVAVEEIARAPRRVALAVGFAACGQVLTATCLWVALDAVGSPVAFPLLLGVLPLASVGTLVPSPGGTAGVEAALVGLLVSLAGMALPLASAAVILYRVATFWAPLPVCGVVAAAFGGRDVISLVRG